MPAPLAAAGIPILGKALAAIKGLGSAKAVMGAKGAIGKGMTAYMGGPVTAKSLAGNFGLDAAFGVMAGLNTPGDLGDKIIAGTTVGASGALGGIGGTLGIGKLTGGKVPTGFMRQATEIGGAMIGDEIGYGVSDALLRAKGGGMTPYEKLAQEEGNAYKAQLEREVMSKYGIYPGVPSYFGNDPFMSQNGLA